MTLRLLGNRMNFKHQRGKVKSLEVRFWEKVDLAFGEDQCWNWIGYKKKFGYGEMQVNREPKLAHRISWEMHFGDVPEGMCVLHKCDNPSCVRPDHLFLGSNLDNIEDRHVKRRDAKGEHHGRSVLTEDMVSVIRDLYRAKAFGCKKIASKLGLNHSTVSHVVAGRSWK